MTNKPDLTNALGVIEDALKVIKDNATKPRNSSLYDYPVITITVYEHEYKKLENALVLIQAIRDEIPEGLDDWEFDEYLKSICNGTSTSEMIYYTAKLLNTIGGKDA